MRTRRWSAAFTLVEIMISMTLAGVLGSIIYVVSGEALASFGRNISINRSYTDARMTIDRIAQMVSSAGHVPVLVDTNGSLTSATPAAGIRFFRANPQSNYQVASGTVNSSNKTITLTLAAGQSAPLTDDVLTVASLGYQGTVATSTTSGTTCTLTMVNALAADCSPTPSAAVNMASPQLYVQGWTQVSFIVVGNQLRYYPRHKDVASDTAAVFNNPANYQVLVNLVSTANNSAGTAASPLLPFSIVNSPTVTVQLYAENPDYNNRTTASNNGINSANTYTFMQSSLGPRSPVILRGPY